MRETDIQIALKYAPIICQQTAGDENARYQDFFCRVDYDGNLKTNDNWNNLDLFKDDLRAEVYFSLVETTSHYFILYSVYHPRDWKPLSGHENDMEHAQVVVKKQGRGGAVQFLSTNAHHDYYVYYNEAAVDLPEEWRRNQYKGTVFLDGDHPIIFVQPGTGANVFGGIGHGILGVVGSTRRRWRAGSNPSFNFSGGQGVVGFPDQNNEGEIPDRRQEARNIKYKLIAVEESLWRWKDLIGDDGIYGENIQSWAADSDDYFSDSSEPLQTRREFFTRVGSPTLLRYPQSFNGNEGGGDAGKTPFAYELGVPTLNYWKMKGATDEFIRELRRLNRTIDFTTKEYDNFFDPAHAWYLRLRGQLFSTDYLYNPYLNIS